MNDVYVAAVGMTRFGRLLDRSLKDLGREAYEAALKDADVEQDEIDVVFVSNSFAGLITGQECIRGETIVYPLGFGGLPVHNVENACGSGGDAMHLAYMAVASGMHRVALVLGVEKAHHVDKARTFAAYAGGMDVEEPFATADGAGVDRTPLVDRQARLAKELMDERGLTREAFATIAARSLTNAASNPYAHRRFGATVEDVLAARMVVDPITNLMSSPVSDGAAAVVLRGERRGARDVRVRASRVAMRSSIHDADGPTSAQRSTAAAYDAAGLGPDDLDLAEVHDASVAYEVMAWTDNGLCREGDELEWAMTGHTEIRGAMPVNVSGGLVGRGHAVGASGVAQIVDLTQQLRGEAGPRQVEGARVALAQIGGGVIDWKTSVSTSHILSAT